MNTVASRLPETASFSVNDLGRDRRRHRRVGVTLLGRFMRANKQEYPCKLVDISVGGAGMLSPVVPEMGEKVVAYFDHIGGIEGTVVRAIEGGFGIELNVTPYKREKLAAQITWLINRHELGPASEARRHSRTALGNSMTTLKLDEGVSIQVTVRDISMSGASIITAARPPIGTDVQLGKLRGRVVRHHGEGIALQFLDIQQPEAIRRYFG